MAVNYEEIWNYIKGQSCPSCNESWNDYNLRVSIQRYEQFDIDWSTQENAIIIEQIEYNEDLNRDLLKNYSGERIETLYCVSCGEEPPPTILQLIQYCNGKNLFDEELPTLTDEVAQQVVFAATL